MQARMIRYDERTDLIEEMPGSDATTELGEDDRMTADELRRVRGWEPYTFRVRLADNGWQHRDYLALIPDADEA